MIEKEKKDKRLDEVIRVKKRPNKYVLLDKTFLEDERLSYKAKGILAYLLSKPDNWKVIIGNLINYSTDGKASVYAGLKELKECGYYEKVPIRNEKGTRIIRWESTVYEVPNSLLPDFQEIENLEIENQFLENQERNNNYINNNYKTFSKNHVQSCQNKEDRQEETDIQTYLLAIRKQVDYANFMTAYKEDLALIDELIDIILDVMLSQSKMIRISGEEKPRELVKSMFMKLTHYDIIHVLEQFKSLGTKIKKKRQYILTMLYHSKMELEAHYTNLVQADFGYKK